jgi:hypothetical protein
MQQYGTFAQTPPMADAEWWSNMEKQYEQFAICAPHVGGLKSPRTEVGKASRPIIKQMRVHPDHGIVQ